MKKSVTGDEIDGEEARLASEGRAKLRGLLAYREITLKSDTEPAIIAFRNRVAEMCNAEVKNRGCSER